ncbi:MAG: hypothetical protein ABF379_14920 [Akkermansiaceae bacterium]|jgi:sugar lactone lactonase YvrE
MKQLAAFLAVVIFTSLMYAHEGHHHGDGVGPVITTRTVTGSEGHEYVTVPGWGVPPNGTNIGESHGDLTLDRAGNVYVATDGGPGIVVFDRLGKFVRFLKAGLAGMHSLTTVTEGEQQFIWGAQFRENRAVKFDLDGNIIATLPNKNTGKLEGGIGGLTEVLVGPDGHVFLLMGYGSKKIHKLKPDGTLIKSYGGKGAGKDRFASCHGGSVDLRYEESRLLVCDCDGRRMIHLTMDLTWIGVYGEVPMRRPANVDVKGEYAAVAEIEGRAILVDKSGEIVSVLLDNPDKEQWGANEVVAGNYHDKALCAPHGIKWGPHGQIYITESSSVGRLVALFPKK